MIRKSIILDSITLVDSELQQDFRKWSLRKKRKKQPKNTCSIRPEKKVERYLKSTQKTEKLLFSVRQMFDVQIPLILIFRFDRLRQTYSTTGSIKKIIKNNEHNQTYKIHKMTASSSRASTATPPQKGMDPRFLGIRGTRGSTTRRVVNLPPRKSELKCLWCLVIIQDVFN